jgi:hypothetical protein
MDTLAQNPETKRSTWKNLLEAGAITLAVMALTALILGAQYQLNDDYAMCLTVSGAYGVPGEHMIFSSSVLGVVLKALFSAAPAVNWYGWMHFAILFLSGTAFSFLILETVPGKLRYLIALAFAGTALVPDILYMQFTMQAYFCLAAGFALFAFAFLKEGKKKKRAAMLVCAALFCLLGVMVRDKTVLTILPFFLAVSAYRLYKKDWRPAAWLAVTCVLCAGAMWADANAYRSNRWQDYFAYNSARSSLLDMPRLDYDANREVFEKAGWSENDYEMFYHWYLADEETFSTEKLEAIRGDAAGPSLTIPYVISDFVHDMYSVLIFFPFCILALCLALCLMTRKKHLLPSIVAASAVLVHVGFIILRRAPIRTVYPHYVLGILLLLLLADYTAFRPVLRRRDAKGPSGRRNAFASVVVGFVAVSMLLMNTVLASDRASAGTDRYAYIRELDRYIAGNKDKLFLSSVSAASDRYSAYSVFYAPERGMFENFIILGGWNTKTPRYYEFMEEHGIENPFLSLLNDNEYLVEIGEPTLIQQYLLEKFGIRTEAAVVESFDRLNVYKIRIASEDDKNSD